MTERSNADASVPVPQGRSRRHPAFGWMKGTVTIAPGVDLTEPACPEWADIAEESSIALAKLLEDATAERKA